jgi:hypothetical protein
MMVINSSVAEIKRASIDQFADPAADAGTGAFVLTFLEGNGIR